MGKKKQKQARPIVTDVSAVQNPSAGAATPENTFVSRSYAEVVDLICEGEMEGLVSGNYKYEGAESETGYSKVEFKNFLASGAEGELTPIATKKSLGFLQSVFWNEVPVVDSDGFYNFSSVNLEYVKGNPAGNIPHLNPLMSSYAGVNSNTPLDLTINRSVGERLYGPEVKGSEDSPTTKKIAQLKDGTTIDKYAKTYSIYNKEVKQIDVNIKVTALFENLQAGPKTYKKRIPPVGFGDTKARTIEYNIYYRPLFDQRFSSTSTDSKTLNSAPRQEWILNGKEIIEGKIDSPYIRTTSINLSSDFSDQAGFEGWEIRIVRVTPESLTSFLKNVSFVDSLVEVYRTQLRYPYSSMVYSQFDARSFSRIPSRSYDTRMTKVKIPNNYDPILKTYGDSDKSGDSKTNSSFSYNESAEDYQSMVWTKKATPVDSFWNGDFKKDSNGQYVREWTDNPAWCLYDLMTNTRYGLGEFIDQSQIDKWTLYEIAQYCDVLVPDTYGSLEPRFTINYIITSREEAFKVLNDLTSIFRGIAYYSNGSVFAVQDSLKNPIYQFNNSNVVDGNFTYSSSSQKARHSVAIVRYNDKRNFFQPAIEYLEDEESVRRYGIREIETTALGATSRGQARRFAKWILTSESEETETVSFSVGNEGAYLLPGDIVQVYDNFRSPLKYSGRTNLVKTLTATNSPGVTIIGNSAYNSIILDQGLNFTSDKLYKFSLLTPTYNTNTGEADEIRRNQIQNLLFNGSHTTTISGDFRSDLSISGSGVCTQIYFSTGATFGGTGNQLDFDNYVITGYTNTGVATNSSANTVEDYSGGCFSGENLIWSIEPNDPNDPEFISGNYSNFKIINIAEDENTYSVSALAYSTGKYDKVTNSAAITSKDIANPPLFPTGIIGETDGVNPLPNSPANEENVTFSVKEGAPYIDSADKQKTNPFKSLEFSFSQAGHTIIKDADNFLVKRDKEEGEYIYEDFDYYIGYTDTEIDSASNRANYGLASSLTAQRVYVVDPSKFENYKPFVREITNTFNSSRVDTDPEKSNGRAYAEYLITDEIAEGTTKNYYTFVFAASLSNDISYGLVSKVQVQGNDAITNSAIGATFISNLNADGVDASNQQAINTVEDIEPAFTWQSEIKGLKNISAITEDVTKQFNIPVPDNLLEYRITVRKPKGSDDQAVNNYIYLEITGFRSDTEQPNFVLQNFLNDPNSIIDYQTDDQVTGWKDGSTVDGWVNKTDEYRRDINNADWLSVSGSGFNIRNNPDEFPVRKFDIVVEAHDSRGNTSAGNKVFDNTILGQNTIEAYGADNDSNYSYDIMGISIDSPSGIIFAQSSREKYQNRLSAYDFISPFQAFTKNLPYAAESYVFPNGQLKLFLGESENEQGQAPNSAETVENFFNNTAGIVYYYTTGDNIMSDGTPSIPTNPAPQFILDTKQENMSYSTNTDNVRTSSLVTALTHSDGTIEGQAFGGIVKGLNANLVGKNIYVHRGYYIFGEEEDPFDVSMPFSRIRQKGGPEENASEIANIEISMGYFDELSLLSSFDENGFTPKTYAAGANKTDKIFQDSNIIFSSRIDASSSESYQQILDDNKNSPSSIFLNESSILSLNDSALAFRGWARLEFSFESLLNRNIQLPDKISSEPGHTAKISAVAPINEISQGIEYASYCSVSITNHYDYGAFFQVDFIVKITDPIGNVGDASSGGDTIVTDLGSGGFTVENGEEEIIVLKSFSSTRLFFVFDAQNNLKASSTFRAAGFGSKKLDTITLINRAKQVLGNRMLMKNLSNFQWVDQSGGRGLTADDARIMFNFGILTTT